MGCEVLVFKLVSRDDERGDESHDSDELQRRGGPVPLSF